MQTDDTIPTAPSNGKRRDRVQRELQRAAAERTPATITHDQLTAEYHRGATDVLRVIQLAVQTALAKHSTQEAPQIEGSRVQK